MSAPLAPFLSRRRPASAKGKGSSEEDWGMPPAGLSMAWLDTSAFAAGLLVGCALIASGALAAKADRPLEYMDASGKYTLPLDWPIALLLPVMAMGGCAAVVSRVARTGEMPRPAEWLGILVATSFVASALPGVPHGPGFLTSERMLVDWYGCCEPEDVVLIKPEGTIRTLMSQVAVGFGVAAFALVILLGVFGRLPSAIGVVLMACAAFLVLWGQGLWAEATCPLYPIVRRSNFSFPPDPPVQPRWLFEYTLEARPALCRWPRGLLFALPAVAFLRDLGRDETTLDRWTEWVGMGLAATLFVFWLEGELVYRILPTIDVRAPVVAAWLASVAVPAWLIVRYEGPVWDRVRSALRPAARPDGVTEAVQPARWLLDRQGCLRWNSGKSRPRSRP
jgi:hypothetical protein